MQRGVFYTPRPVVSYIVRSVDELLRTEFGLADGLADTTTWGEMAKRHKDLKIPEGVSPDQAFVQILDPATGTGTFLVEVIDLIHKTLVAKWKAQGHGEKKIDALWNEYVPKHLLPRLHGYELLMAPYAIAHLKIGLKLYETGYRFGSDERARIYLTNALEPAHDFSGSSSSRFPALAHEAQAVNEIKRQQRFTVVIGNPPYSEHLGKLTRRVHSRACSKTTSDGARMNERNSTLAGRLHQVRSLRPACNSSSAGVGVLGIITNHAYLDGPTFRRMREHLLTVVLRSACSGPARQLEEEGTAPDGLQTKMSSTFSRALQSALLRVPQRQTAAFTYADCGARARQSIDWLAATLDRRHVALKPNPPYYFFFLAQD